MRKTRGITVSLAAVLTFALLAGCGKKEETAAEPVEEAAVEEAATEAPVEETADDEPKELTMAELYEKYIGQNSFAISIPEPDGFVTRDARLSDPVEAPDINDEKVIKWEGYSDKELGLLTPESMPNCYLSEDDIPSVDYDGITYLYANEAGNTFPDYANVWCAKEKDGSVLVLGGWDEYGRKCKEREEAAK